MSRHFKDFISAYMNFAQDEFCPQNFHFWSGLSMLSAAIERKVWIKMVDQVDIYPNLYVWLIGEPASGKSTAVRIAGNLLDEALPGLAKISENITDAKMVQEMQASTMIWDNPQTHQQERITPGYLCAPEANITFKEGECHSIFASLTDWYDCPKLCRKGTSTQGSYELPNVYCSMLVGCTPAHLQKVIPVKEAAGGFASRLTYIVHDEPMVKRPDWFPETKDQLNPNRQKERDERAAKRKQIYLALCADLRNINQLSGSIVPTVEAMEVYSAWFQEVQEEMNATKSQILKHFLARRHVNVLKIAMLLTISRGNEMTMVAEYVTTAIKLIDETLDKIQKVVNISAAGGNPQADLNMAIFEMLGNGQAVPKHKIANMLVCHYGFRPDDIKKTIDMLIGGGALIAAGTNAINQPVYKLGDNPNDKISIINNTDNVESEAASGADASRLEP